MLGKAVPIGTEKQRANPAFGIAHRLLQPRRYLVIVIFCFHHCDGIVCAEVEQVIHRLPGCRTARLPFRLILPSVIWVSMVIFWRSHLEVNAGVMYCSLISSSVMFCFRMIGSINVPLFPT